MNHLAVMMVIERVDEREALGPINDSYPGGFIPTTKKLRGTDPSRIHPRRKSLAV